MLVYRSSSSTSQFINGQEQKQGRKYIEARYDPRHHRLLVIKFELLQMARMEEVKMKETGVILEVTSATREF